MKVKLVSRILIILGIAVTSISCDQLTKNWATEHLKGQPSKSYLNNTFRLTFVKNEGAFLSLGSKLSKNFQYWALKIFPTVLLTGLLLHIIFSQSLTLWQIIAFSFILGGGISNVYDRMIYGSVVDFMNMGINTLRTGIFNFADVSIMTGLFMMIPTMFTSKKEEEKPS